jgi:putative transcriptional regulator
MELFDSGLLLDSFVRSPFDYGSAQLNRLASFGKDEIFIGGIVCHNKCHLTSIMAQSGKALQRARAARRLNQSELAHRAGISRQALSAIETGLYQPSVAVALSLARELGETVEKLFGGDEEGAQQRVEAKWADKEIPAAAARRLVVLARVAGKVVAVAQPAVHLALAPAAGMIERVGRKCAEVATFRLGNEID